MASLAPELTVIVYLAEVENVACGLNTTCRLFGLGHTSKNHFNSLPNLENWEISYPFLASLDATFLGDSRGLPVFGGAWAPVLAPSLRLPICLAGEAPSEVESEMRIWCGPPFDR